MKISASILFILLVAIPVSPQQASNWRNYTDMKNVQSIISTANNIWAATSGGGFQYLNTDSNFKTLHKSDGLNGINLTAVTVDNEGKVWFGSAEGVIDVYNPSDNSVKSILDIYNSDKSSKQINELRTSGDTIFVSTNFGISLINSKNLFFYDTFFKFGSFPSNIQVNSTNKLNLIYACTSEGIAIQKDGATNLSAPESWNVYTTSDGLPSNYANKLIQYNNSIIAATSSGVAIFNGITWQNFLPQVTGNVNDILAINDTLFILSNNIIYVYSNGSIVKNYSLNASAVELAYSNSLGLLAASTNGIIEVYNTSSNNSIAPNSPATNQFPSLAIDNNGILWCASGTDVTGKGFYKYDKNTWTNYNTSNTPGLLTNSFHVVYSAPDNSTYFGNWGRGYIKIQNNSIATFYANTGMQGILTDTTFLVTTGLSVDSKNNLWVLNYSAADLKPLNMLSTDSSWYHFHVPSTGNQYIEKYYNLAVDQYDTKWFCSTDPNRTGLYYFNENKTYDDPTDDKYGYLTTSDGLNSNTINCIVVDDRGDLWVGTNLGVNVISNTVSIVTNATPQLSITSVFTLRQQSINCIAVDPINHKWVGTNQGLLLVNSDGSELLAAFNSKNSPLLSDQITSITVDQNTGTVYVGTDQGLTSFQTPAIKPQDSFTKLFIYPSPFVLKNQNNNLTIDGLIKDSEIKILSITGKLIKDFSSPGGRVAYWDGTDSNGNLVNSGIYLIVAFDKDGNNVFTGKIAVLR
ncbi:MAG: hypothetical protein M1480_16315 [Bacteroidetes bacterium]|nr:hypothetical protein [Bacteroidota bacterium]